MTYNVILEKEARVQFLELDAANQDRVRKKLTRLERDDIKSRHLKHGLQSFVEEVGQYRIAFRIQEATKTKQVVFIGDHKEYEKWYKT